MKPLDKILINCQWDLYYNNLKAQPGAKLDVQLIKGLEKKEKNLQKKNSSKKAKKV